MKRRIQSKILSASESARTAEPASYFYLQIFVHADRFFIRNHTAGLRNAWHIQHFRHSFKLRAANRVRLSVTYAITSQCHCHGHGRLFATPSILTRSHLATKGVTAGQRPRVVPGPPWFFFALHSLAIGLHQRHWQPSSIDSTQGRSRAETALSCLWNLSAAYFGTR